MIVCVSVVGHQVKKQLTLHSDFWFDATFNILISEFWIHEQNNPLYIQSFTDADDALKLHHVVHCSLDVIEERGRSLPRFPLCFSFFVCTASLFSFCLFKRWCQSVSFSEQSQNHIERGFSWPTLSYTQLQSVSTKPCLILCLSVDTYISLGPFLFLLQVWLLD